MILRILMQWARYWGFIFLHGVHAGHYGHMALDEFLQGNKALLELAFTIALLMIIVFIDNLGKR